MVLSAAGLTPNPTRAQSMPNGDNVWGRRSSILPSMSWKKSPEIQIVLDGEQEFIHTYSTFDEISGRVNLRFEKDTSVEDIAICLQGQTHTWVEKVATTSPMMGKTTGKHTFLRVQQPIEEEHLPENNRALGGETYTIPFKFVVPERILDFTCGHKVEQPAVRDAHLLLPPSIGDPMLSGQGNTLMDDVAPKMSKINYCIKVVLLKASSSSSKTETMSEELGIRIVPAREDLPPLSMDPIPRSGGGDKYCLRKEKTVRKGIFKIGKKQGRITAETFQPSSLKLPHPARSVEKPITSTTTVNIRYDPASADELPPSLNGISNKLRIYTYFGAAPWQYFPSPEKLDVYSIVHSHYSEAIELSTRNLSNVEWKKHEPNTSRKSSVSAPTTQERKQSVSTALSRTLSSGTYGSRSTDENLFSRRASTFSAASTASSSPSSADSSAPSSPSSESSTFNLTSIAAPSTSYDASLPYYTATVIVPITLPTTTTTPHQPSQGAQPKPKKPSTSSKPITFLPTFHSCLITRIYALELSLSLHSAPTINLRIPIQLSLPGTTPPPTITPAPPLFNPAFSFPMGSEDDEALAQALESHTRPRAPEYEDTYPVVDSAAAPTYTNTARGARHASLADLPPDYDSSVRRARRSIVIPATPAPTPAPAPRRSASGLPSLPIAAVTASAAENAAVRSGNGRGLAVRYVSGATGLIAGRGGF